MRRCSDLSEHLVRCELLFGYWMPAQLVAHGPKVRSIPNVEPQAWTAQELQAFLREAAGHGLFAALRLLARYRDLRRSELLGLQWDDVDLDAATLSINRGLVSIGYELHESRGKTSNSMRAIDLDPTTVAVLVAWKLWQVSERKAVGIEPTGWVFADVEGNPIHPHSISQAFERIVARAGGPQGPSCVRHTHGTLLIRAGVPSRLCRSGSGTGTRRSPSTPTNTTFPACRSKPPASSRA